MHGILREVWDFDGSGGAVPSSSDTVKVLVYDKEEEQRARWASMFPSGAGSRFPPAMKSELHGFIPNMLMWHAATVSGVGK